MKSVEDLESWYEEQKEEFLEAYLKSLEEGTSKDQAAIDYTATFNKLISQYNTKMAKAIVSEREHTLHAKKMKQMKQHFFEELEKRLPKKWKYLVHHEEEKQ